MTAVYVAIVVAFIINLVIVIAFRLYDKKDKSLKLINNRLSSFRNEVNTTTARINTNTQDCEQRINLKLDEANSVINSVAETLDILQVHQKELADLSNVCKSYENALNSLKIQTEQAESRILAVQSQIREAKEFSSFVNNFNSETERIKNQLNETKQNYTLLVADTQERLQAQAASQEDQNAKMLSTFAINLERFKISFNDFVNKERDSFNQLCSVERESATNNLNRLEERAASIQSDLDLSKTELDEFKTKLEITVDKLGQEKDSILQLFSKQADEAKENFRIITNNIQEQLTDELNKKANEVNVSIDSYELTLLEKEKKVEDAIKTLEAKKDLAKDSFDASLENSKKQLDLQIENLNKEKEIFVSRCRERLNEEFNNVIERSEEQVKGLKEVANTLLETMTGDIKEARDVVNNLSAATEEKIESAMDALNDLKNKLEASQKEFFKVSETLTNKQEELWELENNKKQLQAESDELYEEIRLQREDISDLKQKRIEEEGNLVRVTAQRNLKEKKEEEKANRVRFEDMVEEFPDELVDNISE